MDTVRRRHAGAEDVVSTLILAIKVLGILVLIIVGVGGLLYWGLDKLLNWFGSHQ